MVHSFGWTLKSLGKEAMLRGLVKISFKWIVRPLSGSKWP